MGETASRIGNFYLSVAARTVVLAERYLRYTRMLCNQEWPHRPDGLVVKPFISNAKGHGSNGWDCIGLACNTPGRQYLVSVGSQYHPPPSPPPPPSKKKKFCQTVGKHTHSHIHTLSLSHNYARSHIFTARPHTHLSSSYLSRSLVHRRGTTVDFTTSFLHSSRSQLSVGGYSIQGSLMLSSHRFLCLPLSAYLSSL